MAPQAAALLRTEERHARISERVANDGQPATAPDDVAPGVKLAQVLRCAQASNPQERERPHRWANLYDRRAVGMGSDVLRVDDAKIPKTDGTANPTLHVVNGNTATELPPPFFYLDTMRPPSCITQAWNRRHLRTRGNVPKQARERTKTGRISTIVQFPHGNPSERLTASNRPYWPLREKSVYLGMIHKYEIQGGPSVGYTMRCPHQLNVTERARLSTTKQRQRYGLNRPTIERPLFVGTRGCMDCSYNLNRYHTQGERAAFVLCSFPVYSWDVPQLEIKAIRNGKVDAYTDV